MSTSLLHDGKNDTTPTTSTPAYEKHVSGLRNRFHTTTDGLLDEYTRHTLRSKEMEADDVWLADVLAERRAEADAERVRIPLFESASKPHHFTDEERKRMSLYESIDYWDSHCLVYKDYLKHRHKQARWMKWLVYIAIGVTVGLWAFLFFQSLEASTGLKEDLLEKVFRSATDRYRRKNDDNHNNNSNTDSSTFITSTTTDDSNSSTEGGDNRFEGNPSLTRSGIPYGAAFAGLAYQIFCAILFPTLSTYLCYLFPPASGSGVPDVMAYLNGVLLPRIFNIRVLVVKTLSCICAIVGGLPIGAEGPTIHIGALVGAGLPQGRSKSLKLALFPKSHMFNSPEAARDFISAGAAAGVTAAFGSPIGGLLFVMEEIATFFPVKLAWMVFTSCLACMFVIQLTSSYVKGWHPTDRADASPGAFLGSSINMFSTMYAAHAVPLDLYTFLPTLVLGVYMGFIAIAFTIGNIRTLRLRMRYISCNKFYRSLEPVAFAVFYTTLCFLLALPYGCRDIPKGYIINKENIGAELVKEMCPDPEKQFQPMATLTMTSAYNVLRLLYSRQTIGLFSWDQLFILQILYTTGAMLAAGMFICSGVVIPTLFIGAIGGRMVGEIFCHSSMVTGLEKTWSDPGVVALIGAAAFFGGQSRLTFSLIVIMVELTGDFSHLMCLMVAVILSKTIADKFCHSMYHQIIECKCVPFLDLQTAIHKLDAFSVSDIMAPKVVTLRTTETVKRIIDVLINTKHNCYPIVSIVNNTTFRGTIQRKQLSALLWYTYLTSEEEHHNNITTDDSNNNATTTGYRSSNNSMSGRKRVGRHASYIELEDVKNRIHWENLDVIPPNMSRDVLRCVMDLNPYIDTAALCTRETVCLSRAYYLFRYMGLRHLPVTDRHNNIVGMLSRKDFVLDKIFEKINKLTEVKSDDDDDEEDEEDCYQDIDTIAQTKPLLGGEDRDDNSNNNNYDKNRDARSNSHLSTDEAAVYHSLTEGKTPDPLLPEAAA